MKCSEVYTGEIIWTCSFCINLVFWFSFQLQFAWTASLFCKTPNCIWKVLELVFGVFHIHAAPHSHSWELQLQSSVVGHSAAPLGLHPASCRADGQHSGICLHDAPTFPARPRITDTDLLLFTVSWCLITKPSSRKHGEESSLDALKHWITKCKGGVFSCFPCSVCITRSLNKVAFRLRSCYWDAASDAKDTQSHVCIFIRFTDLLLCPASCAADATVGEKGFQLHPVASGI